MGHERNALTDRKTSAWPPEADIYASISTRPGSWVGYGGIASVWIEGALNLDVETIRKLGWDGWKRLRPLDGLDRLTIEQRLAGACFHPNTQKAALPVDRKNVPTYLEACCGPLRDIAEILRCA